VSRAPRQARTVSPLRRLAVAAGSAFATLTLVVVLVGLWALWTYQGPGPAARSGQATSVVLRSGSSLPEIASSLERAGVIRSRAIFVAMAQASGAARRLKAGEYAFASRTSMAAVMRDVRDGKVVRHWVTIPEGLTSEMAVDILAKSPVLSGDAPTPPEGAILPETYEVQRGEDRSAVLKRMMDDRDKLLNVLWTRRQPGLPYRSQEEAVIMASIVEKETALASERPRIAAVFLNRLRVGMRLQTDPTVIYGLTRGKPLGRGLRVSELQGSTPYNTYLIDGLPPTPIANPGRASLAAALDPPKSDDLYFVADGTGGHVFASTLEQHNANVAKWRAIERQQAVTPAKELQGPPP
jgi:UPF0755 protein